MAITFSAIGTAFGLIAAILFFDHYRTLAIWTTYLAVIFILAGLFKTWDDSAGKSAEEKPANKPLIQESPAAEKAALANPITSERQSGGFTGVNTGTVNFVTQPDEQATKATQAAADAAARMAEIAASNAKENSEQFKIEQRPYVMAETIALAEPPTVGKSLRAIVIYRNTGKTPAIGLRIRVGLGIVEDIPNNPKEWEEDAKTKEGSTTVLGSGIQGIVRPVIPNRPLDDVDISLIKSGKLKIVVYGAIVYKSAFDTNSDFATDICAFYRPESPDAQGLAAAAFGNNIR